MNTLGKTKDTSTDKTYRQFIINCLGENDRRKYFLVTSFGEDCNVPVDSRALTSDSKNKDDKFVLGFLNQVKINELNPGEKAIFSTSEDGKEIKSFTKFLNTGIQEINGNADFLAGFTKLKEGFDTLKTDFNNLVTAYNSHMHPTAGTGAPSPPTVTGTSSTASIDDSKKDNLKCE